MAALEVAGVTLGLREGLIVLIALVAAYMIFVLLRMAGLLRRRPVAVVNTPPAVAVVPAEPPPPEPPELAPEPAPPLAEAQVSGWKYAPPDADPLPVTEPPRQGLELELAQLRNEVDMLRGELAALRNDMHQELAQMRATQTVSPIYGDAMQLALAGYDPGVIAERCGIARAEAELVAALAKRQEM